MWPWTSGDRWSEKRASVFAGTSCVAIMMVSGCATQAGEDSPWVDRTFDELVIEAISDAEANGASEDQLRLLEEARAAGGVSYEQARTAAAGAVECFNSAGADAQLTEMKRSSGLVVPGYDVGLGRLTEAQVESLVDVCGPEEYRYVTRLYQLQPTSRELLGAYVDSQEDVLRTCLEASGLVTDANAGGWELAHQALDRRNETSGAVDCLMVAGIDGL